PLAGRGGPMAGRPGGIIGGRGPDAFRGAGARPPALGAGPLAGRGPMAGRPGGLPGRPGLGTGKQEEPPPVDLRVANPELGTFDPYESKPDVMKGKMTQFTLQFVWKPTPPADRPETDPGAAAGATETGGTGTAPNGTPPAGTAPAGTTPAATPPAAAGANG